MATTTKTIQVLNTGLDEKGKVVLRLRIDDEFGRATFINVDTNHVSFAKLAAAGVPILNKQ